MIVICHVHMKLNLSLRKNRGVAKAWFAGSQGGGAVILDDIERNVGLENYAHVVD